MFLLQGCTIVGSVVIVGGGWTGGGRRAVQKSVLVWRCGWSLSVHQVEK